MKKMDKKKKWTAAAATLAVIAAMAGTFAWFTSQDDVKNHMEGQAAGNDVEIVETFNPKDPLNPGTDVNKDVAIQNTGQYDSLIRVSFSEELAKLKNPESKLAEPSAVPANVELTKFDDTKSSTWADGTFDPSVETSITVDGKTYTLKVKENQTGDTYTYATYLEGTDGSKYYVKTGGYKRATDGKLTPNNPIQVQYIDLTYDTAKTNDWLTASPKPTVTVNSDGTATATSQIDPNITLNFVNVSTTPTADKWYYNSADGYFYYVGVVGAQSQTAQLLDSVSLSEKAGNDYSKFKYDLTVNAKGIQAMKAVVPSADWVNGTDKDLSDTLVGLCPE